MGLGMPSMPSIRWPEKWETITMPDLGTVLTGVVDLNIRDDQWKLMVGRNREVYGLTKAGSLVALGRLPVPEYRTLLARGMVTWTYPPDTNGEVLVMELRLTELLLLELRH